MCHREKRAILRAEESPSVFPEKSLLNLDATHKSPPKQHEYDEGQARNVYFFLVTSEPAGKYKSTRKEGERKNEGGGGEIAILRSI